MVIHLGDITKINGHEIPPVDVICGGSPCQDLSVAGKREGLEGERSGLFMEQIRVVKEMREHDRQSADGYFRFHPRPEWMVWENVPGAYSSTGKGMQKGSDFQAVLTEIVRIVEQDAPNVPIPEKGWPKAGCIYDEMGRWSVAWKLHDAQWWGVPQRRKRIALVAHFDGLNAAEVLFGNKLRGDAYRADADQTVTDPGRECRSEISVVGKGVCGHPEPGEETGEGIAGDPETSIGESDKR